MTNTAIEDELMSAEHGQGSLDARDEFDRRCSKFTSDDRTDSDSPLAVKSPNVALR